MNVNTHSFHGIEFKNKTQLQLENISLRQTNAELKNELSKLQKQLYIVENNVNIQETFKLKQAIADKSRAYDEQMQTYTKLQDEYDTLHKMHENIVLSYQQTKERLTKYIVQNSELQNKYNKLLAATVTTSVNTSQTSFSSESDDDYIKVEK